MLHLDSFNYICIDGHCTGLCLIQTPDKTLVYTPEGVVQRYKEHSLKHARYSTNYDAPKFSGMEYTVGRAELELEILVLLKNLPI